MVLKLSVVSHLVKAEQRILDNLSLTPSVEAVVATGATVSMVFVPPAFVGDAVLEAADAGIELAVIITEGSPVRDMQRAKAYAVKKGMKTIGQTALELSPLKSVKSVLCLVLFPKKGNIGLISKSGTLTYEGANQVCNEGFGITTAVGIWWRPYYRAFVFTTSSDV